MLDEEDHHPYDTDGISSPIAATLLDFCDDGSGGDLFAAVNVTSDMFTASSEDASTSSATTPPGPCSHGDNTSATATAVPSAFSPMPSFDPTLSALLEVDELPVNDGDLLPIEYQYAAAVGVDPQTEQQDPFAQMAVASAEHGTLQTQMSTTAPELMHLASTGYSDDRFAAAMGRAGGYVGLDEALCQPPPGALLPAGGAEAAAVQGGCIFGEDAAQGGFFGSGCTGMVMSMMGMDEIVEYQRMMEGAGTGALVGTHSSDAESVAAPMPFGGNAGEMQMSGSMSPGRLPAAATTETSSQEDPNYKSARISAEERREKIQRYIKKRNERNFSKKIKYACRKTLADSRPRVRGRFAKNDDYGEPSTAMQNQEEYEQMAAGVKAEDILDPDVLQAHLNGMNSYMYTQTVESWM